MSKIDIYKQIVSYWLKYPKTLKAACEYWAKAWNRRAENDKQVEADKKEGAKNE